MVGRAKGTRSPWKDAEGTKQPPGSFDSGSHDEREISNILSNGHHNRGWADEDKHPGTRLDHIYKL